MIFWVYFIILILLLVPYYKTKIIFQLSSSQLIFIYSSKKFKWIQTGLNVLFACIFNFIRNYQMAFPLWLYHFTCLSAMCKKYSDFIFLLTLGTVNLLNFTHLNKFLIVTRFWFAFLRSVTVFCVLSSSLYIIFCELSFKILCLIFIEF